MERPCKYDRSRSGPRCARSSTTSAEARRTTRLLASCCGLDRPPAALMGGERFLPVENYHMRGSIPRRELDTNFGAAVALRVGPALLGGVRAVQAESASASAVDGAVEGAVRGDRFEREHFHRDVSLRVDA